MSEHTPTPWAVSLQDAPRIPQYCQIWIRRKFQDRCVAGDLTPSDAAFIVLACNSHHTLINSLMAMIEAYENTIAAEYGYGWERFASAKHHLQAAKAAIALTGAKP